MSILFILFIFIFFSYRIDLHSKKCWVVLTQFWVKYGQTQPLGYIFKLHFLTHCLSLSKIELKQPSNFLECMGIKMADISD